MNRGQAERAVAESSLSMGEKLTMMMLLRRAHNDTLEIPDWRTPAMPQLAAEVTVSLSTIRRLLAHLELHRWEKRVPGNGRGHKSTFVLLPGGTVPRPCECPKGVTRRHPSERPKGVSNVTPFPVIKGVTLVTRERVSNAHAEPQVSPDIAPRVTKGKGFQGDGLNLPDCIGDGCTRTARNGCRTCWDHAYLEVSR